MERISIGSFSTERFGLGGNKGVIFSKRVGEFGTGLVQKSRKIVENGRHPAVLSNSRTKNDARRVRNVMEPLQTPKKPIKD